MSTKTSTSLKVLQPKRKTLPCDTCKSECCGSFPIGRREYLAIVDHLKSLPRDRVLELAAMRRAPYQCNFLDTDHWRCGVYDARPLACRAYGTNPMMTCTHLPESTNETTHAQFVMEMTLNSIQDEYHCNTGEMTGYQMTAVKSFLDQILSGQNREYESPQVLEAMIRKRQSGFNHRGLTWAEVLKELCYE